MEEEERNRSRRVVRERWLRNESWVGGRLWEGRLVVGGRVHLLVEEGGGLGS